MNKKIFRSSLLTVFLVLIATVILIMGTLYHFFEKQIEAELASEAEFLARAVENEGTGFFDGFDSPDNRVTLIDADGTVLFDSGADAAALDNHARREEIKEAMEKGSGISIRYSTTLTEKTVNYALRLSGNRVLRISTEQYTVITILMGMFQPILLIMLVALILTLVLSFRVSKAIIEPINRLDLEVPENNDTYEELTPLLRKIAVQKQIIEEQLEKRDTLRREFTANVSHELKTPLTSISGFAELIKEGDVSKENVIDFSESIYDEAQRLITLVNDIIKLSELDGQGPSFESEVVDLYELSKEVISRLEKEAAKSNTAFHLTGSRAEITGVRRILDEMLYNLCDNAIKYNRENGRVDVIINQTEDCVNVIVQDTGIGIPALHQGRVFERFYRVDKSHSKKVGGTGLGLAIVKHGAMYHHAKISMESVVDTGTTVTICFPKAEYL